MDIVTYALLNRRITSALSGIKEVKLENNDTLVFITNDDQEFKIRIPSADLVYVGETPPPKEEHYELWVDTSDPGVSSGGAFLSSDIIASTSIGSVVNGTKYTTGTALETVIRDILVSYTKPSITIGITPIKTLYNIVDETLSEITLTASVTKKTNPIATVNFYIDEVLMNSITIEDGNGGIFKYKHTFASPINKTFKPKVEVIDNTGGKNTAQTTVTFIGPSYYGFVPKTIIVPTEEDIKSLDNIVLKDKKNLTYSNIPIPQDGGLYKTVYCYPASLGALTSIVDSNGYVYTNSYNSDKITIDGIEYFYYILKNGAGAAGATQIFS